MRVRKQKSLLPLDKTCFEMASFFNGKRLKLGGGGGGGGGGEDGGGNKDSVCVREKDGDQQTGPH